MIIVSKCLIGYHCKYNGGSNYRPKVLEYLKDKAYIAVCPEQLGALSTPRIPCERNQDRVVNQIGEDKTINFINGANKAYELIQPYSIEYAILKAKSPSCGYGKIYDGTFSSNLIDGNGMFADLLIQDGIQIFNEKDDLDK